MDRAVEIGLLRLASENNSIVQSHSPMNRVVKLDRNSKVFEYNNNTQRNIINSISNNIPMITNTVEKKSNFY